MTFVSSRGRPVLVSASLFLSTLFASAQTGSSATSNHGDEPVVLSPFDVTAGEQKGYQATNTISGTAMNTPLKDVPMSINVITSELLSDMAAGNLFEALTIDSSITQTGRAPTANREDAWSIRGFRNRNVLIDGVTGGDFIPAQLIDRIEIVKGPNTLYGQSDPGGLINLITKRPQGRDQLEVTLRGGDHGVFESDLDANVRSSDHKLGLRVLASHDQTDGYRIEDGSKTNFYGLVGEYQLTPSTTLLLHGSTSKTDGIPSQRSTYSFQLIPTDLNHDGVIDNTIVNGVTESTARYNNNFLPRDYTSETAENSFTQQNRYAQAGLRQAFGSHVNVQYLFVRTTQELNDDFREFNTFNAAGSSDANHSADYLFNSTNAHTLNALVNAETGPLAHHLLLGGRYTGDFARGNTYALRTLGPGNENAILQNMITNGRKIRLNLTKADVLSGVPYWLDDVPTYEELRTLGTRTSTTDYSETRVGSLYATDNISLLNDRLKFLGGLRYIRIRSQSTDITGKKLGIINDQSRATYQLGGVYDLTPQVSVFANTATAFNPNGTIGNTGVFYDPESSRAFEGGLKFNDFWGGRIGGSVAAFDIKKKNVVNSDYNPVTFSSVTEINDDESNGCEAELFFNPTKNWQTLINYSHIDARVVVSHTLAKNLRLEGAAPNRFTFWNSYNFNEGWLRGLRLGGGAVVARGPIQQFGTSNSQLVVENGYTVINLFARYTTKIARQALTFGVNVDNLNNVFFIQARAATNNPRQVTFSVSYDL